MQYKYFFISICSILSITAVASPITSAVPEQLAYQLQTLSCPQPAALTKNLQTNRWSALNGNWKGTTTSLASQIKGFVGAEWQGINLGQIFCIYKGVPAQTFAIAITYHTLAVTPQKGRWTGNKHHNLYKCISNQIKECLFQVRMKPKALSLDQQLAQIRPGHHRDDMVTQGF